MTTQRRAARSLRRPPHLSSARGEGGLDSKGGCRLDVLVVEITVENTKMLLTERACASIDRMFFTELTKMTVVLDVVATERKLLFC